MPTSSARADVVRDDVAGEREPDEGRARVGRLPAIDADERRRRDSMAGFLERLPHGRGDQRFAGLEVAGGLVETHAGARLLLDERGSASSRTTIVATVTTGRGSWVSRIG